MFSKVETFPAPSEPIYICRDDEGHSFVYSGPDTFSRLPPGEERDRWMRKLLENKVTIHEIAGCMIVDAVTGETTLRHSDDYELDPDY